LNLGRGFMCGLGNGRLAISLHLTPSLADRSRHRIQSSGRSFFLVGQLLDDLLPRLVRQMASLLLGLLGKLLRGATASVIRIRRVRRPYRLHLRVRMPGGTGCMWFHGSPSPSTLRPPNPCRPAIPGVLFLPYISPVSRSSPNRGVTTPKAD